MATLEAVLEKMTLCVFTLYGRTFTFRDVEIEQCNETMLRFKYVAQSDGQQKRGTFWIANMAGYSITA